MSRLNCGCNEVHAKQIARRPASADILLYQAHLIYNVCDAYNDGEYCDHGARAKEPESSGVGLGVREHLNLRERGELTCWSLSF